MATPKYQTPIDKYRWLKQQMDKESYAGPVAGYRPEGYDKVWHRESTIDPKVTYWKPNAIKDSLAPYAVYDSGRERQSYWEDPRNVGAWHDYLQLQGEGFEAPEPVDRHYIETAYQYMKEQNGSPNWNTWKPLPFGHMLSYVAQQIPSPESAIDERFLNSTADGSRYLPGTDIRNPAYAVQALLDYQNVITQLQDEAQLKTAQQADELNQFYITMQQENNPIYDQYQKELEESAGADYLELEPWEQWNLALVSAADMKNRPNWSTNIGIVSQGLMAAVGGFGQGALAGGLVGSVVPGLGTAAGATAGGIAGAVLSLAGSVDASLLARKGEEVPNWLVNTNRFFNLLAEGLERIIGVAHIGQSVQEEKLESGAEITDNLFPSWEQIKGGWQPFWTAWKASALQYESLAGTENGGIGDWLVDTVSWLANKFERDREGAYPGILNEQGLPEEVIPLNQANPNRRNSGLTTGLGEVWQLHKGLSGPRALKGSGTIGRESQEELYNMLLDKDNPVDPEVALAIFRDKYGFSGNRNDMFYQTLLDPAVVMPRVFANMGVDYASTKIQDIQRQISVEGPSPALIDNLTDAMSMQATFQRSIGNPIVDISPYPVQMLFDYVIGRKNQNLRSTAPFFRSVAEYKMLKDTGLLAPAASAFEFKAGDTDLGMVYFGTDNSITWKKPDGSVEYMYANTANAAGFKFVIEEGKPVLYVNGQRASTIGGENIYTPPEGTTVVDVDPNAPRPAADVDFVEQTTTVTADVELPDGTRAESVDIDPANQTFEAHGQDGITYIARVEDNVVIDTLNSEGVSIHDPNRVITINPVEVRVNGMTPTEVARAVDTVAILGREYITPAQIDPKLTPRPLLDKSASPAQKVKYFFNGLNKLTRQSQVLKVQSNLHDIVRNTAYIQGGSFTQMVRLLKSMFSGDMESLDTAARKLASSTAVVTSASIYKEAINDSGVDTMVNLWNTPENQQRISAIGKLSEAIDVTPEEFVKMEAAEIVPLVRAALQQSQDANMLALAETVTEDSITLLVKPYIGKNPLPVTDNAMKLKWLNALDLQVEKIATEVYQVQPLNLAQKLLNIDKQILSYGVFLLGYLRTNILSNAGGTAGLASVPVYRSKKGVDHLWERLGMSQPSEGATAYRQITHGALFDALWGGENSKGVLKKISQGLSQISRYQPFMVASGYMETKAHQGADASFVEQAMAYFTLPEPRPEIKQNIINAIGEKGYRDWRAAVNKAYNDGEMNDAYKVKNNLIAKYASIENTVLDALYEDAPDLGTELITKYGLEKPLKDIVENARTPEDVDAQIDALNKYIKEQPAVRAAIETQSKLFEGAEKIRQEGLVGLADIVFQMVDNKLETWSKSQDFWEEAWNRASKAKDTATYHAIIRQAKRDNIAAWERSNGNSLNMLKGAFSVMDATDPKQQPLFIVSKELFDMQDEWSVWLQDTWNTFFYGDSLYDFDQILEIISVKSEGYRQREIEIMNSMAENLSSIFAESNAKTIAGVDVKDTAGAVVDLMSFYYNGDKKTKGYLQLAQETTDMYESVRGLDYNKARSIKNKYFKKLAINRDKLHTELTTRAYNTWHRNHPEMVSAKKPQKTVTREEKEADKFRKLYQAQQANNDVQRRAAKSELDAQTVSKGTVTRSALRDFLASTETDVDISMALVDSVAEAWAHNNGKKPEEWYSNIGELAFVDAESFSVSVRDKVVETLGMTTFDAVGKATLTFAKGANLTTLTHELGHLIEATLADNDLTVMVENFGAGITLEQYKDARLKARHGLELTDAEDKMFRDVAEGTAEGFQKWLMDDSIRAETPARLAKLFKSIADWLHKLISKLSERISSMDFPQELKDLYERVARVVDTAEAETTNANLMSTLPTGVQHSLIDADNVSYPVTARLIDLRNVINSHNTDGTKNTIFPVERQPRTYNQLFVQKIARELNPIKLLEKNSGFAIGPIILNESGQVMVGNHRAGAMRLAVMDYPDRWKAYREELVKRLPEYGLSETDLEGIDQPVLVYTARSADIDAVVNAGNIQEQQVFMMFDNAKRWSKSFQRDSLAKLVIGDNQTFTDAIRSAANKDIVYDFMAGLSESEKTSFVGKNGYLTDTGVSAIKRSLSYLAIGGNEAGDSFLKAAFEDAGSLSANVMNALLESTPAIVKLKASIESGALTPDYAISDILAKGISDYMSFMNLPPKDRILDQTTIFDTDTVAGLDKDLIRFFMNYSSSPKAIKAIITEYVDGAVASATAPGQDALFEMPKPSADLFMDVIRKANGQQLDVIKEVTDLKHRRLVSEMSESPARNWEEEMRAPIIKSLREMLKDITPTPSDMPDWIRVPGLMSEDVKTSYRNARKVIKSVIDELDQGNVLYPEQRTLVLQQAFTRSLASDAAFRKYAGLEGDNFALGAQANKLLQDINQVKSPADVWDRKGLGSIGMQQLQEGGRAAGGEWYGRTRMMRPSEFLSYVPPMYQKEGTIEFLINAIHEGTKLAPPFLLVEWDKDNNRWQAMSHEGRHRTSAFYAVFGDKPMPVFMMFTEDKRAPDVSDAMLASPISKEHPDDYMNAWLKMSMNGELEALRSQPNKLLQDINQTTDDSGEIKRVGDEAMKLLASGGPEDVLNEVIKKATEKTTVISEQDAFEELGADPKREVGIERGQRVIDQPVRGTSMGRTAPGVRPDGEMFSELSQEIDALLNTFREELKKDLGNEYEFPEEIKDLLDKQLPLDQEKLKEKVMASAQLAQQLRHETLVNYSERYGADQVMEVLFPYQLWYTRSALAWLKKIITTPAMMAFIERYKELLKRNSLSGFPTRVGGKHMIPYGDEGFMFMNWLDILYPPEQIFGVVDNFADLNDELYDDTVRIIRAKILSGEISAAEAEESIKNRNDDTWNSAMAEATINWHEESGNAVTMTSLAMLPRASFSAAYYALIGQKEKISPLAMTKLGNMLKGVDPDGFVGLLGEIVALPENTARKAVGLSREGQWGEMYVDKKLTELAMSGAYSPDEVVMAMLERKGEAYDTAARLSQVDLIATSQPGGIVYHAIETQNLDGIMPAIMTALFPKGLYSMEEMKYRGLQAEYNQAWDDFSHGDAKALDKFFEAHPEYEARLPLYKEPEERLREYAITAIWDAYGALSSADKSLVTDQLGKTFETLFLDNKTRNYDEITVDTLVLWGKQLGAGVPESALAGQQVEPLEYYREDVSAAVQQFTDYRKANFPNWYTLQQAYFDPAMEDEDKKAQFKKDFPEFQEYMDWKADYVEKNPLVAQYLEEKSNGYDGSELTEFGVTTNEWMAQFDPAVGAALIMYAYGEPLPPAAKSELVKVWEALGEPNYTFDLWLKYGIGR